MWYQKLVPELVMVTFHLLRLSHDKLLLRTVGSALYDVATSSKGPSSKIVIIIVTVHTESCGSVGLRHLRAP